MTAPKPQAVKGAAPGSGPVPTTPPPPKRPAPSSPDRTETLAQALAYVDDQPQSVHLYRPMAEYGLRRLDAYDREHRNDGCCGGVCGMPPCSEGDREADLRERLAAEVEAERDRIRKRYEANLFTYGSAVEPGSRDPFDEAAMDALDTAARIVRGGV